MKAMIMQWLRTGRAKNKRAGTATQLLLGLVALPALLGAKGCDVGQIGTDEVKCGGRLGDTCQKDEFCSFGAAAMCGQADATGVCEPRPEVCTAIYAPVCGCDGKTHGNECAANEAGVSVLHKDACEGPVGKACGGLTGLACAKGEFCDFPIEAQCGAADQTGTCKTPPDSCPDNEEPVCGCDGATYPNECVAKTKGASIVSYGACGNEAQTCGGLAGLGCNPGEYCSFPIDAKCGAGDMTGTCAKIPEACDGYYKPVCGCDGKTHSNACEAASQGVSIVSFEACEGGGPAVGDCNESAVCGKNEFCDLHGKCDDNLPKDYGNCTQIPEACDLEYKPVCGCDGKQYSNECEANRAGVSVDLSGTCMNPEPSCKSGADCKDSEMCYLEFGICSESKAPGVCQPRPESCTTEYAPVCGCDGKTYGNLCAAQTAGINVLAKGECETPSPNECGGLLGLSCNKGEFCNFPVGTYCGASDQMGTCETLPDVCAEYDKPVCGCDGKTYSNECTARAFGVSVSAYGACAPSTGNCGGLQGLACAEGEFCNFPKGASCGAADQMGTCDPIPEGCPKNIDPVCGCDDKTYDNECAAHRAQVSVLHTGECTTPPQTCVATSDCKNPGEYCRKTSCDPNEKGQCQAVTSDCANTEVKPVCGCDGTTYQNQCEADMKQVPVSALVACEDVVVPTPCKYASECSEGTFCDFDGHCEDDGFEGKCMPMPVECKPNELPTSRCGCDGKVYTDKCFADQAGVSSTFDFTLCGPQ